MTFKMTLAQVIEQAKIECVEENQCVYWVYVQHNGKAMRANCHPGWGWHSEAERIIGQCYSAPKYNVPYTWVPYTNTRLGGRGSRVELVKIPHTYDMHEMVNSIQNHDLP